MRVITMRNVSCLVLAVLLLGHGRAYNLDTDDPAICGAVPDWFFPWGESTTDVLWPPVGQIFTSSIPYAAFGQFDDSGLAVTFPSSPQGQVQIASFNAFSGGVGPSYTVDIAASYHYNYNPHTVTAMRCGQEPTDLALATSLINNGLWGLYYITNLSLFRAKYVCVATFVCMELDGKFATFQAVITTNGCYSFAVFHYHALTFDPDTKYRITVSNTSHSNETEHLLAPAGTLISSYLSYHDTQNGRWEFDINADTPRRLFYDTGPCGDCRCAVAPSDRKKCPAVPKRVSKFDCKVYGCCWERRRKQAYCYQSTFDEVAGYNETVCHSGLDAYTFKRDHCGWKGISKEHCLCLGCCYDNSKFQSAWCYTERCGCRLSTTITTIKGTYRVKPGLSCPATDPALGVVYINCEDGQYYISHKAATQTWIVTLLTDICDGPEILASDPTIMPPDEATWTNASFDCSG